VWEEHELWTNMCNINLFIYLSMFVNALFDEIVKIQADTEQKL